MVEQIVVTPSEETISGDAAMSRQVVFDGEHMMVTVARLAPSTRWPTTRHPQEEFVYVVRGGLEYDDGRRVGEGVLTVNRFNQDHPGRSWDESETILIEIYAPPVDSLRME